MREAERSPDVWSRSCIWLTVLGGSVLALYWPTSAANVPVPGVDLSLRMERKGFTNSVGMRLVPVLAGSFVMGSPPDEKERELYGQGSEQQHEVEITKDFYLSAHEVTQKQYRDVMGYNPSFFSHDAKPAPKGKYASSSKPSGGKDKVKGLDTVEFPVENVSWEDAQEFCTKLNLRAAERRFRVWYCLPTEAQWEYACRGGHLVRDRKKAQLPFHFREPSASLGFGQANFAATFPYGGGKAGPSLDRTNFVGKNGEPNALGLCDMHGNAAEWCSDWYDPKYYAKSPRFDPTGPDRGESRVRRGGACNRGEHLRAADRLSYPPTDRVSLLGFRVAAAVTE